MVRLVVPRELEMVTVDVVVRLVAGKVPVIRPVTGSMVRPLGKLVEE